MRNNNKMLSNGFKPLSRLSVLAAALALAGCTLAPNFERPNSPVGENWAQIQPEEIDQELSGAVAAELPWQDFFKDERLIALIELSLENNRDMRIAILNIERAGAQYQIQRSDLLPDVGVSGGINRQTTGAGGKLSEQYSESSRTVGGGHSNYNIGVGISSYELDLFGRVRSLNQTALASYLGTIESRKTAQMSLISSVAAGYYILLADDELIKLTEDTLKTRLDSLELTQLKFEHGVSSELDVRQAETLVEGAKSSLAQLKRQRAQDANAFMLLIGGPIPEDLPQGLSFAEQLTILPELNEGVPSEILVRRPDILAAEQQIVAANGSIGAARAAFLPRISLTASLGKASGELDDLFRTGHVWNFTPSINLPIFTGGRNVAALGVARADQKIAVAGYEKAIQVAFREVSDTLAGRATYGEQLSAMGALVKASEKTYELSDLRYRNGVASYIDLLDAQRMLFDAQQQQILIQLAMLNNQVMLYKVLGGGWTDGDEEKIWDETHPSEEIEEEES